jgi:hypothetical protein
VDKPNFTLENWQWQRVNEYLFLNCEQSAFERLTNSASTDADLVIAAIGADAVLADNASQDIIDHFHLDLGNSLDWLKDCLDYMVACSKSEHEWDLSQGTSLRAFLGRA